jgi:hypothetical protein
LYREEFNGEELFGEELSGEKLFAEEFFYRIRIILHSTDTGITPEFEGEYFSVE